VWESLPGAGLINVPKVCFFVVTLSAPGVVGQACNSAVLAKNREWCVHAPPTNLYSRRHLKCCFTTDYDCRPTPRRQLTCSHGPVSTHTCNATEMHSIRCMPLRVICATDRAKEQQEQSDTRPRCDFTLPWQIFSPSPPWTDECEGRRGYIPRDIHSRCRDTITLRSTGYSHHTCLVTFTDLSLAITTHHTAFTRHLHHHHHNPDTRPRLTWIARSLATQITCQTCANRMLSASISKFPSIAYTC
jgi:hypothetical protein